MVGWWYCNTDSIINRLRKYDPPRRALMASTGWYWAYSDESYGPSSSVRLLHLAALTQGRLPVLVLRTALMLSCSVTTQVSLARVLSPACSPGCSPNPPPHRIRSTGRPPRRVGNRSRLRRHPPLARRPPRMDTPSRPPRPSGAYEIGTRSARDRGLG